MSEVFQHLYLSSFIAVLIDIILPLWYPMVEHLVFTITTKLSDCKQTLRMFIQHSCITTVLKAVFNTNFYQSLIRKDLFWIPNCAFKLVSHQFAQLGIHF